MAITKQNIVAHLSSHLDKLFHIQELVSFKKKLDNGSVTLNLSDIIQRTIETKEARINDLEINEFGEISE